MPDITTFWSPSQGYGDWSVSGVDLVVGDDLQTAVLISLFTDRRAAADDVIPDGSGDPRGWWGDAGRAQPLGSKLWLLDRAKQTEEVRLRAKDYIQDALQWMVDSAIASSIEVDVTWQAPGFMAVLLQIYEPAGGLLREFNYQWAWKDAT